MIGLASPVWTRPPVGSRHRRRCCSDSSTPLRFEKRGREPTSATWPSSRRTPLWSARSTTAWRERWRRCTPRRCGAATLTGYRRAGRAAGEVARQTAPRTAEAAGCLREQKARVPQDDSSEDAGRRNRGGAGAARVAAAHTSGAGHRWAFRPRAQCGRPGNDIGGVGWTVDVRRTRRRSRKGDAHRHVYCHAALSGSHIRSKASPVSTGSAKSMTDSMTGWNCGGRSSRV